MKKLLQSKTSQICDNVLNEDGSVKRSRILGPKKVRLNHPLFLKAQSRFGQLKSSFDTTKNLASKELVQGCCQCVAITAADFGPGMDQPYVIFAPGKYTLSEDVAFNGTDPFTPAIIILPGVNNVTLDLCEHTLSQGNSAILTYGVWIGTGDAPGNNNITVQNGSIVNFTGCAISLFGEELISTYSDLHFTDLNLLNNGIPGFDVDDSGAQGLVLTGNVPSYNFLERPLTPQDALYRNVVIERVRANNSIGGVNGASGILVNYYDNLVIRDCQANGSTVPFQDGNTNAGSFAYVLYGVNLQMTNCQGNDTRAEDPGIQQVGGLDHENSQNSYFQNCQFNNGYGVAAFIVNSNISINRNVVFENCQFNNNSGGSDAVQVYGAHGSGDPNLQYDGQAYKFINCQFNGSSFEDNLTQQALSLGGMILQNVSQITLENCECRDLFANGTSFNSVDMWGFYLTSEATDIPSSIGNDNDIVIKNCIVSNFRNIGGSSTIGFRTGGGNLLSAYGEQVVHYNTVIENCTVQRVYGSVNSDFYNQAPLSVITAGIGDVNRVFPTGFYNFPGFPGFQGSVAKRFNTFIKNCTVSDVHGVLDNDSKKIIPISAGIILESVENVVVTDNQVTNCDRGILLTGTDDILPGPAGSNIPNLETCFQVAATKQDALATPPNFIPLFGEYLETNKPGLGPFNLVPTLLSPPLTAPITAVGGLADPLTPCSGPAGNVNGKIGIVQFVRGPCGSTTLVNNAQAGGDVATIIINLPVPANFTGNATQYNASVSYEDGQALINALTVDPTIVLTITNNNFYVPGSIITNITRGNTVTLSGSELVRNASFLCTQADLNALCWQPGDTLIYNANGNPNIAPLVSGQTYYLIVYRPGFVVHGLVKDNDVTSCTVSGFEDTAVPCTESVWLANTAYCNGPGGHRNYVINWAGHPPIAKGNLIHYPRRSKFESPNISITCGKCDCKKKKRCP